VFVLQLRVDVRQTFVIHVRRTHDVEMMRMQRTCNEADFSVVYRRQQQQLAARRGEA